jgi:predicted GIY-YIG superfamily endonuclease
MSVMYSMTIPLGAMRIDYTVNFSRRIRQHNGDIKGGAFYTKNKGGPWSYLLKVESPHLTRNGALSLEWSIK